MLICMLEVSILYRQIHKYIYIYNIHTHIYIYMYNEVIFAY